MSDISNTNNQSESELDEYGVWVKQTENPATDVFNEEKSMDMDLPDFDLQDNFEDELDKKDTDIENDNALDNFLNDFSEVDTQTESDSDSNDELESEVFDESAEAPAEEAFENGTAAADDTSASDIDDLDFSSLIDPNEGFNDEASLEPDLNNDLPDSIYAMDTNEAEPAKEEEEEEIPQEKEKTDDFNPDDLIDNVQESGDEISADDFMSGSSGDNSQAQEDTQETADVTDAFSEETNAGDSEVSVDDFLSSDSSSGDGEVSLDEFGMGDSSGGDGEISLDEFGLGDLNSSGDGEISLDSFMDEGSFETQQKEEEVLNEEPLDIDLNFEDVKVEEEEVDDSSDVVEPVKKEAPKDMEAISADDFDSFFIEDTTPKTEEAAETAVPGAEDSGEAIDLSEFGFAEDSANMNPIIQEDEQPVEKEEEDFEMSVDIDDTSTAAPQPVMQDESNEEDELTLDLTESDEEEKQEDISLDSQNQGDDDFDLDSILDNIEDEDSSSNNDNAVLGAAIAGTAVAGAAVAAEVAASTLSDDTDTENDENTELPSDDVSFDTTEDAATDLTADNVSFDSTDDTGTDLTTDEVSFETEDEVTFETDDETEEDAEMNFNDLTAEPEESVSENTTASEDTTETTEDAISLEDFMGSEGFTDGGSGVTGIYPETETDEETDETKTEAEESEEEIVSDTETSEEDNIQVADAKDLLDNIMDENKTESETIENVSVTMEDLAKLDGSEVVKPTEADMYHAGDSSDLGLDTPSVPDTFNEESDSLNIEENDEVPENLDTSNYSVFVSDGNSMDMENTENQATNENNEVLKQITSELQNLRMEITSLKSEFETIKTNGIRSSSENVEAEAEASPDNETGFFSSTDEDDTIALSGNELDNILSSADFTTEVSEDNLSGEETIVEENEEAVDMPAEAPAEEKGFFSETDEDDTIALSGNELDNILSSAEFTTEADNSESEVSGEEEVDTEAENNVLSMDFSNDNIEEPVFNEDEVLEDNTEDEVENEIELPASNSMIVESSDSDFMGSVSDEDNAEEAVEESTELAEIGNDAEAEEIQDIVDEVPINEEPVEQVFNNWDEAPKETEEIVTEESVVEESVVEPVAEAEAATAEDKSNDIPSDMKEEIKSVLTYMDQLLENLPEDKIEEFARSEQFETYKKLFSELGIV